MDNYMKETHIYAAIPAYVYTEEEGPHKGQRFETSLTSRFMAKNNVEAVKMAVAHTKERYEAFFKDAYKDCSLGSIKVYMEYIGRIDLKTGKATSRNTGQIFEWKYDRLGTLDEYLKSYILTTQGRQ